VGVYSRSRISGDRCSHRHASPCVSGELEAIADGFHVRSCHDHCCALARNSSSIARSRCDVCLRIGTAMSSSASAKRLTLLLRAIPSSALLGLPPSECHDGEHGKQRTHSVGEEHRTDYPTGPRLLGLAPEPRGPTLLINLDASARSRPS